jgi:hypothetical protein
LNVARYAFAAMAAVYPAPSDTPEPRATVAVGTMSSTAALVSGTIPEAFVKPSLPDMNAAASAGLGGWFGDLPDERKSHLLHAILFHAGVREIADRERAEWLRVLAGCADAGRHGVGDAYILAKAWSATSRRFDSATFDRDWNSLGPRHNGATVGTLLYLAETHGFDLDPWREEARTAASMIPVALPAPGAFATPVSAFPAGWDLPRWVVPGFLQRGEVTILAAAGAGGKTAVIVGLCAATTGGRTKYGPFDIVPQPGGLRVLYISAEESHGRISALAMGACTAQGFTRAEVKAALSRFTVHDAKESGLRFGVPTNPRDAIAPEAQDAGLALLSEAAKALRPDVIVLDTASALLALPNENDNLLVTALLGRLGRLASRFDTAVLVAHHVPKMSRESAASLRGDAALVRGGSAWTNTPRVAWTITSVPASETGQFLGSGVVLDRLRRFEPAKINDIEMPPPAFFVTVSARLGKTGATVRAAEWVQPISGTGGAVGAAGAVRCAVLTAVLAGCRDSRGATVPLSPSGKKDGRSAIQNVAQALMMHDASMTTAQAEGAAKGLLKELMGAGIVTREKVRVPKYKPDGTPNGTQERDGVVPHPHLAPWWTQTAAEVPTTGNSAPPAPGAPAPAASPAQVPAGGMPQ